jgi:acyl transferase domain-containing protein/NADPH:quinone reductase-like Zn-dependent oxidoreductase/short-subunit dehydrogenase/acyl carrier protein
VQPTSNRFANLSPLKQALLAVEEMQARLAELERGRTEPVAIIGMGCRFPRAENPESFWRLLRDGVDAVREVPASRWKIDDYYDPNPDAPGKMSSRWGGFLDAIDLFDPEFFGISPREAVSMDPQQRLLLEVAWEALENAGQGPRALRNCRTGVFTGITGDEFSHLFYRSGDLAAFSAYFASGIARSVAGGRISYTLGIQGPNLSIDTACSSSLVAVHTACLYLRMRECRMALAGGSNAILSPEIGIAFSRSHMLSADGRCKAFDSRADGFVRAEGCGMVALKLLSDAIADGDRILALVRGSAVNQDGRSSGLTVPNLTAQQAVIRQALANGSLAPNEVGYIEAHGTGTSLGDPIEAHALATVLGSGRTPANPLLVGSVKTNLGHLEAVAGIAGLIKTVLMLQNEEVPPHLHFREMNPRIDWCGMPVEIPTAVRPWPRGDRRRIAGVSAFGFSGTNAHVLIEEAPVAPAAKREMERPLHAMAVSAKSERALARLAERYAEVLARTGGDPGDLCHTANAGRAHFEHRLVAIGGSTEEIRSQLLKALPGERSRERDGIQPVFLFPGQGAQYAAMGQELYRTQPVFRQLLDECAEHLAGELEKPLLEVLWGNAIGLLDQTAYTQPALFAVEYAVAKLWQSWGIEPAVVLGHSVGEYVAACVAGVYSLAEGLKLIAARGRLMQAVAGSGAMLAVQAEESEVQAALTGLEQRVSIAALNGPRSIVVSGYAAELATVERLLIGAGKRVKRLVVSHGFHSPQMAEMEESFERVAAGLAYGAPRMELISSVTGQRVGQAELSQAGYWRRQVRQPVRFGEAVKGLGKYRVFLEVGPGTTLTAMGRQCLEGEERLWVNSLRKGRGEWQQMLESLGQLYVRGAEVNWEGFDARYGRRKVALPTYPFERQRYWIETKPAAPKREGHPLLGPPCEIASDSGMTVWEIGIGTETLPYLADHRAFGAAILPLTAYLEMLAAAAGGSTVQFENVAILEPLALPPGEFKTLQVIRRGDVFRIFSRDRETWKQHVEAQLSKPKPAALFEPLDRLRERIAAPLSREPFYADLKDRGMDFGPSFRSIRELWAGTGEALALVEMPVGLGESEHYRVHPALLDGCFQALAAAIPEGREDLYLPVHLQRFDLYRSAGARLWAHVALCPQTPGEAPSLVFDIRVFDEEGPVAEACGLEMRRAAGRRRKPLFEVRWDEKTRKTVSSYVAGDWLILEDQGGIGAALAEQLTQKGARATLLPAGSSIGAATAGRAWNGIVYLWALDAPGTAALTLDRLEHSQKLVCGGALELVQSLAGGTGAPRLWLVTRGAQAVMACQESVAIAQSSLWGMAQAIATEHPEWRCTSIDLDPASGDGPAAHLLDEIMAGDGEDQVALRAGRRLVARLIAREAPEISETAVRLTIASRGAIDNLAIEPALRQPVPPGSVEIQVDAAGLNFRDVLNVLGMFSGPLGSECAGHIVAVGDGVDRFHPGDEVIAMASGGHEGFAITDARLVTPKPANLTMEKSATLPTAFLTARYSLEYLAKLRRGQRVLIHSGAGGVGLAAVAIAQRAGAEIFATAGNDRKRAFLRSLGVSHVMNSRTLDFAREILEQSDGQGVEVVLNSLAGDFIPASFSALARGGMFLEIGKRGIWTQRQVEELGRNFAYHAIDLGDVAIQHPELLGSLLRQTVAEIETGQLQPLPVTVISYRDAADAFRYMAQAQHTGKIVLRQSARGARIPADATYLISGGLGALGLVLARWLVERGARHVLLVSRGEPGPEAVRVVQWAEEHGARILCRRADVSKREQLAPILSEISKNMPPLRGILHAAGVLDDGVLQDMNWSRFERVLAPKVAGAWLLAELTAATPIDFFVLFSSAASVLGAPGQANYAAANAFQDGLAHELRRRGLPAISINWGAWSQGMAAREGLAKRQRELGMGPMSNDEGLALMERILAEAPEQVGAGFFDWRKFIRRYPHDAVPPLFSTVVGLPVASASVPGSPKLLGQLRAAPESGRTAILHFFVQALAGRVLSFPQERRIDPEQPLSDLGLDSLMALEFRNSLAAEIEQSLPATLLFSYPAIADVERYLSGLLFGQETKTAGTKPPGGSLGVLDEIAELSDEEVDRLLAADRSGALR